MLHTSTGFQLDTPAGLALGGNQISGLGNGAAAIAVDINAIAFGNGAATSAAALSAIALGYDSRAYGNSAVALGAAPIANNAGDIALGSGSVSAVVAATNGVVLNGVSYGFAGATPASTLSVGRVGAERSVTNVAAGRIAGSSTDAVNGSQLFATNSAVDAIGATAGNSVQYDDSGKTSVTLGGSGTTNAVALTNVAAGSLTASSTDAVNGSQLFATNNLVQNLSTSLTNIAAGDGVKCFHANSILADAVAGGVNSVAVGPEAGTATTASGAVAVGFAALAGGGEWRRPWGKRQFRCCGRRGYRRGCIIQRGK